ncbi:MAG: alpha/beta hydrolase [Lachnospiraceae bacterium]
MGILKKGLACAGVLAAAGTAEIAYFYGRTMKRQKVKMERTIKMAGTDWSQYADMLAKRKEFMLAQPHEDVYITTFDYLRLHGVYFPAINDACGKKRVVICMHGYTSRSLQDFTGLTDYYFRRGYAMLQPDARAHGESEGEYIGFGCLDRKDLLKWIDWVIETCGEDVEIILHGISMGGSTALMASGLELPKQVKGIVSDCAFTSPKEVFTHVLKTMYHLPSFPIIPGADVVNRIFAGYGMDECNAKREVAKAKIPVLFIHGEKDTFVPARMCKELYDCCASEKKMLIVEGAAHGESYYKNTEAYEKALDDFLESI